MSRFDDYIYAFPECCESFTFPPSKIVANRSRFTGHDVIFDYISESVKGCVSSLKWSYDQIFTPWYFERIT